jgi:hypothetical protein
MRRYQGTLIGLLLRPIDADRSLRLPALTNNDVEARGVLSFLRVHIYSVGLRTQSTVCQPAVTRSLGSWARTRALNRESFQRKSKPGNASSPSGYFAGSDSAARPCSDNPTVAQDWKNNYLARAAT